MRSCQGIEEHRNLKPLKWTEAMKLFIFFFLFHCYGESAMLFVVILKKIYNICIFFILCYFTRVGDIFSYCYAILSYYFWTCFLLRFSFLNNYLRWMWVIVREYLYQNIISIYFQSHQLWETTKLQYRWNFLFLIVDSCVALLKIALEFFKLVLSKLL